MFLRLSRCLLLIRPSGRLSALFLLACAAGLFCSAYHASGQEHPVETPADEPETPTLDSAETEPGQSHRPPPLKHSMLLITIDTLRADRLGCYGYSRRTTPFLDRLAGESVLYRSARSTVPLTTPSHASLFTGFHPRVHAVLGNSWRLGDGFQTLAEQFKSRGYKTAAFVSSMVLDPRSGIDQGFDHYDRVISSTRDHAPEWVPHRVRHDSVLNDERDDTVSDEDRVARGIRSRQRRGAETVDRALQWLDEHGRQGPFFVWVHLYDPHQPYDPEPPFSTLFGAERGRPGIGSIRPVRAGMDNRVADKSSPRSDPATETDSETATRFHDREPRDGPEGMKGRGPGKQRPGFIPRDLTPDEQIRVQELYDGEVAVADFQVGRLMTWVHGDKREGKIVLAVVGDHGETLGDHDAYYGHHHVLYDTSLLVPVLLRPTGNFEPGVNANMLTLTDLMPILLEEAIAGEGKDPGAGAGSSLDRSSPVFCETYLRMRPGRVHGPSEHERRLPPRFVASHRGALLEGRWKLILPGGEAEPPRLFDLEADPLEKVDLAGARPNLVKALSAKWEAWSKQTPLPSPTGNCREGPEEEETLRRQLEALGYVE